MVLKSPKTPLHNIKMVPRCKTVQLVIWHSLSGVQQQIKFSWHYVLHSQMMEKVAAILSTKLIPFYRVTNIKVHSAYVYSGLRGGIHRFSHYLQIAGKSYSYHRVFPTISKCYMVPPQHSQAFSLRSIGFLCDSYSPFLQMLQGKPMDTSQIPVNICSALLRQTLAVKHILM